jgi:hypothetical protein
VSGFPATTAGLAQSFKVTAVDAYGNLPRPRRRHSWGRPRFRRWAAPRAAFASISFVTLGEAAQAVEEYDKVLELESDGGWSWKPVGPGT